MNNTTKSVGLVLGFLITCVIFGSLFVFDLTWPVLIILFGVLGLAWGIQDRCRNRTNRADKQFFKNSK